MDLRGLVEKQHQDGSWGQFAQEYVHNLNDQLVVLIAQPFERSFQAAPEREAQ
jgi:hypothetical protein